MSWSALLEATQSLHRIGMSVPAALEQHARSGEDPSHLLSARWLGELWRLGDPVIAMRALAPSVWNPHDCFVLETLAVCLEHPTADHHRTLGIAVDQLRAESAVGSPRWFQHRASRTVQLALVVVALAGGDTAPQARRRAVTAFAGRGEDALGAVIERAERGATPTVQAIENLLGEERSRVRRSRGRRSWRALPQAMALALAATVALLGAIAPGSAELSLAGW